MGRVEQVGKTELRLMVHDVSPEIAFGVAHATRLAAAAMSGEKAVKDRTAGRGDTRQAALQRPVLDGLGRSPRNQGKSARQGCSSILMRKGL